MKNIFHKSEGYSFEISPGPIPNDGILFVDHQKYMRSGHLSHAMVEYEPGKILCFYANCSGDYIDGHNAVGWLCYKRSLDGGKTWCEDKPFPYSKTLYDMNCGVTSFAEKAVLAPDGAIVLFNLVCCTRMAWEYWEPYWTSYMKSYDGGETWTKPKMLITNNLKNKLGRVYDAKVIDGRIYALYCASEDESQDHNHYHIYVSDDNGDSFNHLSDLDFPENCFYGAFVILNDGSLAVYAYTPNDEYSLLCSVSHDMGKNWEKPFKSKFAKMIRNPQIAKFKDTYFCFGRSGNNDPRELHLTPEKGNAVVYTSPDGINWDEGQYLRMRTAQAGSYSNTLITGTLDPNTPERLLYQTSFAYDMHRTNILHWWIDAHENQ